MRTSLAFFFAWGWVGWLVSCEPTPCEGASCDAPELTPFEARCPATGVLHGPWSLAFDETSATVRWDACAPGSTEITVTPEAGGESLTVTGTQTGYEVTTTYDALDGVEPDLPGTYYLTEAKIEGLVAGACYRYALSADPDRSGRVCTAKAVGDPFTFVAIGDTNPAIGDTAGVLDNVLTSDVDFTIHLGDIQYYQSVFDSWAAWFPAMAPLLEHGAFMPSVGNHEYENDTEFQDYYARLFGGAGFGGNGVEWYTFQSGGVAFFSVSTESDLDPGSPQADWLEGAMADAAASPGYRFGVVYFHKPMLTLSDYSQNSSDRAHFAPLFRQYGVKLIMSGHVHGYERFVDDDLTYIVSGGGGALLHDLQASAEERPEEAALRQAAAEKYHATIISVGASSIDGKAISNDGEELDSFTIPLE